jgi:hypothetical protein
LTILNFLLLDLRLSGAIMFRDLYFWMVEKYSKLDNNNLNPTQCQLIIELQARQKELKLGKGSFVSLGTNLGEGQIKNLQFLQNESRILRLLIVMMPNGDQEYLASFMDTFYC